MEGALHTFAPSPGSMTSWRTDWVTPRLPEVSSTMQRSPAPSNTVILRKVPIWSTPALVREPDRNTRPAFNRSASQEALRAILWPLVLPAPRGLPLQPFLAPAAAHAPARRRRGPDPPS